MNKYCVRLSTKQYGVEDYYFDYKKEAEDYFKRQSRIRLESENDHAYLYSKRNDIWFISRCRSVFNGVLRND